MDFEIPEWGNESFSYHFTSSLDQTIIDTAITNAGEKRKKRKKKSNTDDDTLSPKKKLNQNKLEDSKTLISISESSKDENEVSGKVKLSKKKKLKTGHESSEFQNHNSDNINDKALNEQSPIKNSKKNKKSGKHNKYKELSEKQKTEKNKFITPSEKSQDVSTKQKSNSTMEWNISNNIKSENKTQNLDLTINDSVKSKENEVASKENKKNNLEKESPVKHDNKKCFEILDTETTDILHQNISRKPIVENKNTENKIQTGIKAVKKRNKKKKNLKVDIGEDEDSQELDEVTAENKDISKKAQKIKKRIEDGNNIEIESDNLANKSEVNINKTKKNINKPAQKESKGKKTKNMKKKSVQVSFEHDMEVIEDEDEDIEDSDLRAELESYLGKLKSKTKEELFASDSEDELSEEEDDDDDDEPGDDLESSGDVKEELGDNMKENNEEKDDKQNDIEGGNIDIQEDNDIDSEDDNESTLDEEDENDTDSNNDEIDNEGNEDEIDDNEDEIETDDNEGEIETDDSEDETDSNEDESDMDSSENEDKAKKELDFEDESSEDNTSKSILGKNKDGKKKKFDSEKLSALLQESESNKEPPKKLSPADALRQKMSLQLNSARFRLINEQLYTSTGDDAMQLFGNDPEAFQVYHEGYKSQVAKWPINPLDLIIKSLQAKPAELVVADFGCGEAQLSRSVPQKKVFSLDLQAACEGVIVTDMAHTPLKTASVDIAVFCLSLMGTNIKDYVYEANRVLKQEGILKVAEVESRFTGDIDTFIKVLAKYGFKCTAKDTSHNFFFLFDFKKTWVPKKSFSLPDISLKPCVYKKR